MRTGCNEIALVLGVLEAPEEAGGEAKSGGVPLAERGADHGPDVHHGPLRPHRQSAAHRQHARAELHYQRLHIEHLRVRWGERISKITELIASIMRALAKMLRREDP